MVRAVGRLEEVMRWGGKLSAQIVGCRCWIWGGAVCTGRRRSFTVTIAMNTQLNQTVNTDFGKRCQLMLRPLQAIL